MSIHITQKTLRAASCGMCKEGIEHQHPEGETRDYLVLHPRCHIGSPTWVRFKPGDSAVEVVCAECDEQVALISVGHGPN